MKKRKMKRTLNDRIFYFLNGLFLAILAVLIIYPLYFIIIASISDSDAVLAGRVVLYPVGINFDGFVKIIHRSDVWRGYLNTIIYRLGFEQKESAF